MRRIYVQRQCYFLFYPRTFSKKDTTMSIIPNEKTAYISEEISRIAGWIGARLKQWAVNYIAYRERQSALAALRRFNDRELKDIGLFRCELEDAVAGRLPSRILAARAAAVAPRNPERLAA